MEKSNKYVITKTKKEEFITYPNKEQAKGFDIKPKNCIKYEDMINVNKMVIISPDLIGDLINKKCKRTLDKILKLLSLLDDDNGNNSDTTADLVLNEMEKFKQHIEFKYKKYLTQKEYKLWLQKIEILENEVKLHQISLNTNVLKEKAHKGR